MSVFISIVQKSEKLHIRHTRGENGHIKSLESIFKFDETRLPSGHNETQKTMQKSPDEMSFHL